jgi:hypothetical protein
MIVPRPLINAIKDEGNSGVLSAAGCSCCCVGVGRRVGGDAAACGLRDERVVDMATLSARAAPTPSTDLLPPPHVPGG